MSDLRTLQRYVKAIVALPDGHYRWVLGQIRRQKRAQRTGKPVARVPRRGIRMNADDLRWSKAIRERDPICRVCGMGGLSRVSEEATHIHSRKYKATRCILENGLGLCRSHHRYYTERPVAWAALCRLLIGDSVFDDLQRLAHHLPTTQQDFVSMARTSR